MSAEGFEASDHRHMAHALRLAARGSNACAPNPRVGCVLVNGAGVVGEGWHQRAGGPHAETIALAAAGAAARGATVYVSLEPCCHTGRTPPCTEALIQAGVQRVVAAMQDPDPRVAGRGIEALQAAGIRTSSGLLAAQAAALNAGFISRIRRGRPWLRSKIAASLDGRTAMANGDSKWITGVHARREVQRLRAQSGAILTGIGTVLADDPSLDLRLEESQLAASCTPPMRVVLDSALRMPVTARMLGLPGRTVIFTSAPRATRLAALAAAGAQVEVLDAVPGGVDCAAVLRRLAELGVNDVLVEAGARLNGALLRAGLVDEWTLFLAPVVMGSEARAVFEWPGLRWLSDCRRLHIADCRQVGEDLCLTILPGDG